MSQTDFPTSLQVSFKMSGAWEITSTITDGVRKTVTGSTVEEVISKGTYTLN